jgi:two-component system, cell cycle sensor histidine kinase PleC
MEPTRAITSPPLRWYDSGFADRKLETAFRRYEAESSVLYARTALGLAAVLFASFGISDWLFAPEQGLWLTLIRVVVIAVLGALWLIARRGSAGDRWQLLMQIAGLAIGLGFVAIVVITPMPLRHLYLDCVILVITGIFVVLRLTVLRAALVMLMVVAAYDVAFLYFKLGHMQEFIVYQLMIVAAAAIGGFCAYVFERQRRLAFVGRYDAERHAGSLERALRNTAEAQLRAEQAARVKSDFVAHVSHELRTPLNAVIGFGEVLEREIFGPLGHPKYAEYAHDIRESGQHLLSLINDVLDLSKIEAGRMELQCETLVPQEVVRASLVLVSGLAQTRNTQVKAEVPTDLPLLYGDGRAIKQMLVNLLSNALKFAPERGDVRISARPDGADVVFTVSDDGPGMTPEQIKIALTPFGQVSGLVAQSERGTGLGLALANRLAELHGRPLDIVSAPGSGTRVAFRIPQHTAALAAVAD